MDDIPELTVADVAARLGEPSFVVIDNNGAGRYRRSHVPSAINLNAHLFEESALPVEKATTLVFYCSGPG